MYEYRQLTDEQKAEVLRQRQLRGYPLHAPPHLRDVEGWFLITAATYEHQAHFCAEQDRAWLLKNYSKNSKLPRFPVPPGWSCPITIIC